MLASAARWLLPRYRPLSAAIGPVPSRRGVAAAAGAAARGGLACNVYVSEGRDKTVIDALRAEASSVPGAGDTPLLSGPSSIYFGCSCSLQLPS